MLQVNLTTAETEADVDDVGNHSENLFCIVNE